MLKFKGEILSELNYLLPGYKKEKKNLCLELLNGGTGCLHKWQSLSCGNIQDLTWWVFGKLKVLLSRTLGTDGLWRSLPNWTVL